MLSFYAYAGDIKPKYQEIKMASQTGRKYPHLEHLENVSLLDTRCLAPLTASPSLPAMGPVLGVVFTPMIGSASDSHRSRFGRRRPFIWMLSLGVLLGLQVMPQARRLAALISPQNQRWLEAALQAAAACLLEFCGQVSPSRSQVFSMNQ